MAPLSPRAAAPVGQALRAGLRRYASRPLVAPAPEPIPEPAPLEPEAEASQADDIPDDVPLPPPPALEPLAARILVMAIRGFTPEMAAHDLRLHPKRVRQIARDHLITFHRQR